MTEWNSLKMTQLYVTTFLVNDIFIQSLRITRVSVELSGSTHPQWLSLSFLSSTLEV